MPGAGEADTRRGPPEEPKAPSPYKCCLESFDTPTVTMGRHVRRAPGLRRATMSFKMLARFRDAALPSPDPQACQCRCCEYRQEVRGFFRLDGTELVHPLARGQVLDKFEWREDGFTRRINGAERHSYYGHRDRELGHFADRWKADRELGCTYESMDQPFLQGSAGDPFEIDLEFRGKIIDTCTGTVVETKYWTFRMKGLLSRRRELWE